MSEKFDLIVVLGGGLKNDTNGWRTTNFDEGDNFGAMGDRLRVEAGYLLYSDKRDANPGTVILASGGKGQLRDVVGAPAVSVVLKKELSELGVPSASIVTEKKSGNTYQQMKELEAAVSKHDWRRIAIISNRYHLPRVRVIIEFCKETAELRNMLSRGDIQLLSAEDLLMIYQPKKWKNIIGKAYRSGPIKKRLALERAGVRQIKAGTYKLG